MYQIAVCDDEQSDLHQSVQLTERILQEAEIPCDVTAYGSGVDLLREIQQGRHFDLLLLDVIMDALDGMALASHLKEQAAPPGYCIHLHRPGYGSAGLSRKRQALPGQAAGSG